jgi:uncharacterized phage protein (TIGR01671 family)
VLVVREIKFRGKRIKTGEWLYGDLMHCKEQVLINPTLPDASVEASTIGQYTGLKDKNGKEIYEGDILSNGQHINWIIDYHIASFVVKHVGAITEDSWVLNRGMAESREVIGNIYENPELLEEAK